MVFSSTIFIFGFLPILFLIYFISPKKVRNYVLLLFSLVFYIFGGPKFLLVLLSIVIIDYFGALLIIKYHNKWTLGLVLAINIGVLFYFKYFNFFLENINYLFDANLYFKKIVMPIGISFFTFQAISYVVDVYKNEAKVQKNPLILLLYISFFPQLVAGPIVRYSTIESELNKRKSTIDDISIGLERFILGLAKKVIIANQLGLLSDTVYEYLPVSTPIALIACLAYMMQIYFDFSGYSDMAIGLGRIFGFHFLENFNFPYIAKSITEFWRRWHISLSSFFKDYVYIPLGGNRKSKRRTLINLFIVWLLTGFWHGASWNFILWGLYYFVILLFEKKFLLKYLEKGKILPHIYTITLVLIGWILFRSASLNQFIIMMKSLFAFNFNDINTFLIYLESYFMYFILAIIFSTPIYYVITQKFEDKVWFLVLKYIGLILLFIISIMFLTKSTYNPFIYFRF